LSRRQLLEVAAGRLSVVEHNVYAADGTRLDRPVPMTRK